MPPPQRLSHLRSHLRHRGHHDGGLPAAVVAAAADAGGAGVGLTPEQAYEFDLRGFVVLRSHYSPAQVQQLERGIDELQAIPCTHAAYTRVGVASDNLARAMEDPEHESWAAKRQALAAGTPPRRLDMGICGTADWDLMVRDESLNAIHHQLAGGACNLSATYFIEKQGPVPGGGMHNGGFPRDKNIYFQYNHHDAQFACSSTKSVAILSDMSQVEHGPFAAIPGSHKSNLRCPLPLGDPAENPLAVPVLASAGDVIIFSEGMTHNAYAVQSLTRRRSIFFCYMPSIDRDNLPSMRMSMYPPHVLARLPDCSKMLTLSGYI
jgi:hypothetical protein